MEKNYDEDERKDLELIKEALSKYPTYQEAMKWLSNHLSTRYGSEFSGTISISYNLLDNNFVLRCGHNTKEFEENELEDIPAQIKFFRKTK